MGRQIAQGGPQGLAVIQRAMGNDSRLIRLLIHLSEKVGKFKRARAKMPQTLGRSLTKAECDTLLASLKLPREDYKRLLRLQPLSLSRRHWMFLLLHYRGYSCQQIADKYNLKERSVNRIIYYALNKCCQTASAHATCVSK